VCMVRQSPIQGNSQIDWIGFVSDVSDPITHVTDRQTNGQNCDS